MKILAVDDDKFIIEVLELALLSMGHEVVRTAQSAAAALDVIAEAATPFDCILMDIQMPEMDGIELVSVLRELPDYRKTPIVMLTAMSDKKYVDRAFNAGATDYITKPFEPVELKSRLNIAERLNSEMMSVSKAATKLDELVTNLDFQPAVNIEDSFDIDDMPGYMSFHAFRNYLQQLDRSKFYLGGILALKIVEITALHRQMGGQDYMNFIADIADGISENIYGETTIFSYAGYGLFVVATTGGAGTMPGDDLADMVQDSVSRMCLVHRNGTPIETEIVQSDVHSPSGFGASRNEKIIETAVSEAEQRAQAHANPVNQGSKAGVGPVAYRLLG